MNVQVAAPDAIANSAPNISPIGKTHGGETNNGEQTTGDMPNSAIPGCEIQIGEEHVGLLDYSGIANIAEIRPGPKIRRAVKIQDGHSTGEQLVYQALWNVASVESTDTRLIRIGYGGLQSLCGLDKTNCKDNIQSLIRKLAVEVVSPFSVKRNQGNVYRIFSAGSILKRRKAAGMEWVIRNKGVRFVDQPTGE
jgi:hypothetical protein